MEQDNSIFTKDTYLQLLNRAYTNMIKDNKYIEITDNNYFRICMTFSKGLQLKFKIKIPHNLNEKQFIMFILGILSRSKLKHIIQINIRLYNGSLLNCFDFPISPLHNGTYYFGKIPLKSNYSILWNNIRLEMLEKYNGPNQDALNAIIKQ